MKKLTKEEIKFQIDQLRKDKIAYATESTATALVGLMLFWGLGFVFPQITFFPQIFVGALLLMVVGYWLFMVAGNLKRMKQIEKLEKELEK